MTPASGGVIAYACDGKRVAEWFRGPVSGNDFELRSEAGAIMKAELEADRAHGTITLPGRPALSFEAAPENEYDYLYRAEGRIDGNDYLGGWIVLARGVQRGAVKLGSSVVATPTLDVSSPTMQVSGGTLTAGVIQKITF